MTVATTPACSNSHAIQTREKARNIPDFGILGFYAESGGAEPLRL
jgi:hypothetical protein